MQTFNLVDGLLDVEVDSVMQGFSDVKPGESRSILIAFDVKSNAAASAIDSLWVTFGPAYHPTSTPFTGRGGLQMLPVPVIESLSGTISRLDVGNPGPLQLWRKAWFGTYGNGGVAGNDADPDGDSVPNLVEYAVGSNPFGPTSGIGAMPLIDLVQNNQKARVKWRLDSSPPPDVTVRIETNDKLSSLGWSMLAERTGNGQWSGPAAVTPGLPIQGQTPYSLIDPTPTAGKAFQIYRLAAKEAN